MRRICGSRPGARRPATPAFAPGTDYLGAMSIIHDAAVEHLRRVDPTLARLIERVGPCRLEARAEGTHFDAVVRAIVYQQLSGKAASTILGRVLSMYGNRY